MQNHPKSPRRRGKRSSAKAAPPSDWKIRLYDPVLDPDANEEDYLVILSEEDSSKDGELTNAADAEEPQKPSDDAH
jgi:hypothetical protein